MKATGRTACVACGSAMTRKVENVQYGTQLGLGGVTLAGVTVHHCAKCGEREVAIPRLEQLLRALSVAIAKSPPRLSGEEVRFLRKYLGHSGADFARIMGVDAATVSRWENDATPISASAQRLVRLLVLRGERVEEYPTESLAKVSQTAAPRRRCEARRVGDSWRASAA